MKISTISLLDLSVDNFCLSGTNKITEKTIFFHHSMSLDRIMNNFRIFSFQNESGGTQRHLKFQNWTLTTIYREPKSRSINRCDSSAQSMCTENHIERRLDRQVRMGQGRIITGHLFTMHNNNHNCFVIMRVQSTWIWSRATLYFTCVVGESLGEQRVILILFTYLCEIISDFEFKLCCMTGDDAHSWSDNDNMIMNEKYQTINDMHMHTGHNRSKATNHRSNQIILSKIPLKFRFEIDWFGSILYKSMDTLSNQHTFID